MVFIKIVSKKCKICKSDFDVNIDTKKGQAKQTCSVSCSRKLGSLNNQIEKECIICNRFFKATKSYKGEYTCDECKETHKRYKKSCTECGKNFQTNKKNSKTCSKQCAAKLSMKNLITIECFCCKKKFERPSIHVASNKRVFCSNTCLNRQYSIEHPSRYGGTYGKWNKLIRNRDNNSCLLCGNSDNCQVHHFIKVRTFLNPNDAHSLENMGLFCSKCHRIVEYIDIKNLHEFYELKNKL